VVGVCSSAAYAVGSWRGYDNGAADVRSEVAAAQAKMQERIWQSGLQVAALSKQLETERNRADELADQYERAARDADGADRRGIDADGLQRLGERWGRGPG